METLIPEWKQRAWKSRVKQWTYKTLKDQLEEVKYLQLLLEEEIMYRDLNEITDTGKGGKSWTASEA